MNRKSNIRSKNSGISDLKETSKACWQNFKILPAAVIKQVVRGKGACVLEDCQIFAFLLRLLGLKTLKDDLSYHGWLTSLCIQEIGPN